MVVYFYPAAMTPGCTKQACDFRDSLGCAAAAGYTVLGISPDKPAKLAEFVERERLTFPLLSDPDARGAGAVGCLGREVDVRQEGDRRDPLDVVVGPDGTVELARYNVKATGHVAALRKALGV